ncbi:MAG: carbohydrate ABC transporter permease [Paracholeplasma sp.]|jgi:ABC-type glycerol-3-phosphate transport system permease component|uniref:ABC-type sugar transport system, permease component n=1 Tax=Acholeplasma brassicae TaxID=61635 RepID=U4KMS4_9MOLU|nr:MULTISPECIES: carbohydrate ABC transporter permease [Paracholeplasma]MDY3195883.1 carbohydrate ABC transporter permease [Paracholeplasma sp.]CCV65436.1 ABC-type sugar transport system, permease component [Paracholeplasma brassicae]
MNQNQISDLKLQSIKKKRIKKKGKKRLSRSWQGDLMLSILLIGFGLFSAYPLVFTIANAFKPLDEIFLFPPKLFPRNFTLGNFTSLFNLIGNTRIPISRYFYNTLVITLVGVSGHVFLAALAAYPLAKQKFPGKALINQLIVYSLMFSTLVTAVPNYLVISWLGLIDTHLAIIIPSWGFTLGLFLMKQFMVTIPTELLEAAKMDGAGEYKVFFIVVMPLVKPAWLTVIILLFQQLWSTDGGAYIFTENLKPLSFALQQIVAGGIARTGASAAVALLMLVVPITVFIISQSRIIDTMAHSGIK